MTTSDDYNADHGNTQPKGVPSCYFVVEARSKRVGLFVFSLSFQSVSQIENIDVYGWPFYPWISLIWAQDVSLLIGFVILY